jgi:peptidoglycan hydrolase-like protein with peptidoglycan-binding domain
VRNRTSRGWNPAAAADDPDLPAARRFAMLGKLLRACARRPMDSIGLIAIVAAAGAIVANALHLQQGPHPAPILSAGGRVSAPVETTGSLVVMPRPRPPEPTVAKDTAVAAQRSRAQIVSDVQRELVRRGFYEGAVDGIYGPKIDAAIREFEQAAGLKPTGDPTEALLSVIMRTAAKSGPERSRPAPPAPMPPRRSEAAADSSVPSTRVAAIQRALADFGYGQIKPTGVFDGGTQSAIEKFERERKLPVSGQISDRLTRELSAVTGRPLE